MEADKTPKTKARESIWSVPYVILMVVNLFQSMAAFMTSTTLPLYADSLGASTATVGIVVSSFSVSALLVRPFAGPAFDSFSRKWMLLASQAIICISLALYGFADSIGVLCAIRLLHGIGIGCSGPLAMSLVSEFLPMSKFASGISIYALAQSFAQVIGPAAGLFIVNAIGFLESYLLSAGLLFVAMLGIFAIKDPRRERLPYRLRFDRMFAKEAMGKGFALMLLATSFSCMTSYVVLYGYELRVANMGLFFVVYALCLVATRPISGNLADRFGTPQLLMVGMVFFAGSYITLSVADGLFGFILAAVIGSAGFGCCGPLLQSYALASVPSDRRGAASNTAFTGLDLGMLLGPVAGGCVVEQLASPLGSQAAAYGAMWLVMLVPIGVAAVVVSNWIRRGRRASKSEVGRC